MSIRGYISWALGVKGGKFGTVGLFSIHIEKVCF